MTIDNVTVQRYGSAHIDHDQSSELDELRFGCRMLFLAKQMANASGKALFAQVQGEFPDTNLPKAVKAKMLQKVRNIKHRTKAESIGSNNVSVAIVVFAVASSLLLDFYIF